MEDNESLKGGDGDMIRENFKTISVACQGLYNSTTYISKVLNDRLVKAIELTKGKTIGESGDKIKSTAKNAGVLKK